MRNTSPFIYVDHLVQSSPKQLGQPWLFREIPCSHLSKWINLVVSIIYTEVATISSTSHVLLQFSLKYYILVNTVYNQLYKFVVENVVSDLHNNSDPH